MATKIQWVRDWKGSQGESWNFIKGCFKKSDGCKFCYAINISHRHSNNPNQKIKKQYEGVTEKTDGGNINFTGRVNFDEKALIKPLKKKKPTTFFISMSDLFYPGVEDWVLYKAFAVMALCPQHTFQILTKRPVRMKEFINELDLNHLSSIAEEIWFSTHPNKTETVKDGAFTKTKYIVPENWYCDVEKNEYENHLVFRYEGSEPLRNVWLGISVENQKTANHRIPFLLDTIAAIRFISAEPLLDEIDLEKIKFEGENMQTRINSLTGVKIIEYADGGIEISSCPKLDKVILGGESGKFARKMDLNWARIIRDQCRMHEVPFFFKQVGGRGPKKGGIELDGKTIQEMPGHYYRI